MPERSRALWMFAFITVFMIGTYAVSQLTLLVPRILGGTMYAAEVLVGIGYSAVALFSILVLGRMIYSSERAAGRVKRRVRFFE